MNALMMLPFESTLNYINALACGLIAVRIFIWRTTVDIDSITLRLLTYLFIITFADVTVESLSLDLRETTLPETLIDTMLCIMCYINKDWNVTMRTIKKA